MGRVEPAGAPSTRMLVPLIATMGASTMLMVFSAIGSLVFLSTGTSPDRREGHEEEDDDDDEEVDEAGQVERRR